MRIAADEITARMNPENHFRKDVLSAVERLKVPILRWPGGNFVSSYNWEDGVGPKNGRPRRFDTARYAEESNRFSTNEFITYCRRIAPSPSCFSSAMRRTL